MKRIARVVARNNHSVWLNLIQTERCVGCPSNCNKPLINLFSSHNNLFKLSKSSSQYQLLDPGDTFQRPDLLNQMVQLEFNNHDLMKSSARLYLVPLLIIMLSLLAGHWVGVWLNISADLTAGLGFIGGLLLVYLAARRVQAFSPLKFRPKVTIL